MQIKKQIPNLFTLANLACGLISIILLFRGDPIHDHLIIAGLVFAAMVFDFFDGFVARALKVNSPIGKQLDSLADVVTFGVLPGFLLYYMFSQDYTGSGINPMGLFALIVPLFSALRLAKFNVDERQSDRFFGVPTPANTLLILSFFLIFMRDSGTWYCEILNNQWVLAGISVVCSVMLVMDVPLLALKFKDFSFEKNKYRFILIGCSLVLGVILSYKAVPLIILLYIVLSLIETRFQKP